MQLNPESAHSSRSEVSGKHHQPSKRWTIRVIVCHNLLPSLLRKLREISSLTNYAVQSSRKARRNTPPCPSSHSTI
ncbi:hypothetical protein EUGRSUZ_D01247 [Eucalyptus grandis]|uniref:Uncharacterized protein n=2 Tax=Eucalyptus grandis TaxID=71139 RepID=A0ACC3L5A9_EUCGR|nr:hypothetical protein EUGRSUZ_D01247 [Eucalyptus grandis]